MLTFANLLAPVRDEAFHAEQSVRLRAALYAAELRHPGLQDRVEALLARAHAEATAVLDGQLPHTELADIAGGWASLRADVARLEHRLPAVRAGEWSGYVSRDGSLWGIGRYEQLDPGWTEALIHWLENHDHPAPFIVEPAVIDIPDRVRVCMVGDWGTGYWAADAGPKKVRDAMLADDADIAIHLGDVYYAGSESQEHDNFVSLWPAGKLASLALNSNHEMYDGARAYYQKALGSPTFAAQRGCSYFALRNTNWLIVGLDSAYHATGDLYMDGAIDPTQGAFLARLAASAGNRRVIVLSHHLGLDLTGVAPTALWQQVVTCLGRAPDVWYWGHAHNSAIYAPFKGCAARCIGHGAIPYGEAAMLAELPSVAWFETQLAGDPALPLRVLNGYLRATLSGPTLLEEAVGEDRSVRWTSR